MKRNAFLFLSMYQLQLMIYFLLTAVIYFLALLIGNQGVSLNLFGGGSGDDGYFYLEQARNIAEGKEAILTSVHAFVLGYITKILGFESIFAFRLLNYFGFCLLTFTSLSLLKTLVLEENVENNDVNYKNSFFIASCVLLLILIFYPSLLMNVSLSIFRDVWIYFFYVLSVLFSVRFMKCKSLLSKNVYIILIILSLFALGAYRKYAVLSFVLTLVVYYFFKIMKKLKVNFKFFSFIVFLCFFIYYTFLRDFVIPYVGLSLQYAINYRASSLSLGGSQMNISLDQGNALLFIMNYLYSYIANLIGPLPWHINGLSTLFVFVTESFLFTVIIIFLYKHRKFLNRFDKFVILHAIIWIALIAVSNDNYGTGTRLRVVCWLLLIIVFSKQFAVVRSIKYSRKK